MLLSDRMQIKIADLGLSKIIEPEKTHASTQTGTPLYMSPEVFHSQTNENAIYYPNTDVWYMIQSILLFESTIFIEIEYNKLRKQRSLGCVLYELLFLEYAFPRGQRGNPHLPSNVSSCEIFSAILPKYLHLFQAFLLLVKIIIE